MTDVTLTRLSVLRVLWENIKVSQKRIRSVLLNRQSQL